MKQLQFVDLFRYFFTRPNYTMFVFEDITKKILLRYDTLIDSYIIVAYRGLFTKFGSTLINKNCDVVGFFSSNSNFSNLAQFSLYCTNHLSEYRLTY